MHLNFSAGKFNNLFVLAFLHARRRILFVVAQEPFHMFANWTPQISIYFVHPIVLPVVDPYIDAALKSLFTSSICNCPVFEKVSGCPKHFRYSPTEGRFYH